MCVSGLAGQSTFEGCPTTAVIAALAAQHRPSRPVELRLQRISRRYSAEPLNWLHPGGQFLLVANRHGSARNRCGVPKHCSAVAIVRLRLAKSHCIASRWTMSIKGARLVLLARRIACLSR